ncbi:hypothetical protein GQ44DRAFT_776889 [Phaeosphaeriaceae sp. PMI808]|nr:hypothetical protein GQ44DRAFT_776889 [Phaeosphaeriaceae sp. PMI808]
MARSTTVWAAALVLASFSGSGPLLTTAEAMPAPGPENTQGRPRYYFPRHVKRQIVTNSTAPAAATSSSKSSSKSSTQLESRQVELPSILNPGFVPRPDTSTVIVSKTVPDITTSTVTSIQEIIVTPVPEQSENFPGTGNLPPTSERLASAPPPSGPEPPSRARPSSGSSSRLTTPQNNDPNDGPSNPPRVGSTAGVPSSIVRPTPAPVPVQSSSAVSNLPSPSPSSSGGNLLSTLLGGIVGSTGSVPSSAVQPTPAPQSSAQSSDPVVSPLPSSAPASSFLGPFIVPGSTGGVPSSVVQPTSSQAPPGGLLSSLLAPEPTPASSGGIPSLLPTPTPASPSSEQPILALPSSGGIVIGITTALGTGAPTPTPSSPLVSSGAIPTSEAIQASSSVVNLPSVLSSVVSEVPGVLPSGSAGPTAPTTPSPAPTPSGVLPPVVSSLLSEVSSLLSSAVPSIPESVLPSIASSLVSELSTASAPTPLPPASGLASSIVSGISSGAVPSPSGAVPTPSGTPSAGITPPIPSETLTPSGSAVITSPTPISTPSGILPSGASGTGVSSGVVPTLSPVDSTRIPASESTLPSIVPSSATVVPPTSTTIVPPTTANGTISAAPTLSSPSAVSSSLFTEPATIPIPSTPVATIKPSAVNSQKPIGSDNATSMVVPTNIIQETSSIASPTASASSSGFPSSLPRMIAPPGGVVSDVQPDTFMGQICFKWQLNYPFVSANDGGTQIFHYLPRAIADGLNISQSDVRNYGLKPLDTTQYQGFITTLALFTIPKDLQGKLAAQLRNPADLFWRNKDQTVNDLTSLINTACPLPAGKLPGDNSNPNQPVNPAATNTGAPDALGGDVGASRPINGSAAGIATGAVIGAIAYGAAMFFVARRYRNKRIAHQRSSSVPSTGSRMTYGSIPGGAAAWMHGARNGRSTPASRGSSSSQGRSVRTQQISAPVMAENSLGWN